MKTAQSILSIARSFIGLNEANGSYKEIMAIYNAHKPLARSYAIQPTDSWCDCFVSAVAIKAGAVDIIGTEIGCEYHIGIFKEKGIWIEDGTITPKPGDIILYNFAGKTQPNNGHADHIGYVERAEGSIITTIEGNWDNAVVRRTVRVGNGSIRGFARPKYVGSSVKPISKKPVPAKKPLTTIAKEVIDGKWGNGDERKKRLVAAGYNFDAVQVQVNKLL